MASHRDRNRAAVALALLGVAMLLVPTGALATGPWIDVGKPVDGGFVTTKRVAVEGCATAPSHALTLNSTALGSHPGVNMVWRTGVLRFKPVELFRDDFEGSSLDPARWKVSRDPGTVAVTGSELTISSTDWYAKRALVESLGSPFSTAMDWTAEFKLKIDIAGSMGGGGGISTSPPSPTSSTAAVYATYEYLGFDGYKVYAAGSPVLNESSDFEWHVYSVDYRTGTGHYVLRVDDQQLAEFVATPAPKEFWFGQSENGNIYDWGTNLRIDYAELWSFHGGWTSATYDLGHNVSLDAASANWTSNHASQAAVGLEARMSYDNLTWSSWTPISSAGPSSQILGRYAQLRVAVALPLKDVAAEVAISAFGLAYHDPLTLVEVRKAGGAWVPATGLERWRATLDLEEDSNVIEVRAADTSGAVNMTSLAVIVDTTPPTGTMSILDGRPYTNELNVTLYLNATDEHGVQYVEVSNAYDMLDRLTFPYAPTVRWHMESVDGDVSVFARFVDFHGLRSTIVSDTIIYDSIPPTGSLMINGGDMYSPTETVRLDLDYSDSRGVALVELSNDASFNDIRTVGVGDHTVPRWQLAEGDDGPRTVYMRLTDVASNTAVVSATIEVYHPRAVGNVTIEDGAAITRKSVVQLRIEAPPELRADRMQVASEPAFMDVAWELYTREKLWILPPGDGTKWVFVRFEDFRSIVSLPINASIVVDTTPPEVSVVLDEGAHYTTMVNLTAHVSYRDASRAVRMWAAPNDRLDLVEPTPFAAMFCWTIPGWEGDHVLYVKVEDLAGNSAVAFATIHYSTVHPQLRLELPGGPISNAEMTIGVVAKASDPYGGVEMQLAFGGDPAADAPWLPVNETVFVEIPKGTPDGVYEVRGRARNVAGLLSEPAVITVRLDREAPMVDIVEPAAGTELSQKGLAVLLVFKVHDPNGVSNISYRADGGDWMFLDPMERSAPVDLSGFGEHTIVVRALDIAGNPGTTSTSFRLDRTSATVASSNALFGLVLLIAIILAGALAYVAWRGRTYRRGPPPMPAQPVQPSQVPQSPPPQGAVAPVTQDATPRPSPAPPSQAPPGGPSDGSQGWEEF